MFELKVSGLELMHSRNKKKKKEPMISKGIYAKRIHIKLNEEIGCEMFIATWFVWRRAFDCSFIRVKLM